jgi:hypothetical protein
MEVLAHEPRSVSSLAREISLPRADVEDALLHMIRRRAPPVTASWSSRRVAAPACSPSARNG